MKFNIDSLWHTGIRSFREEQPNRFKQLFTPAHSPSSLDISDDGSCMVWCNNREDAIKLFKKVYSQKVAVRLFRDLSDYASNEELVAQIGAPLETLD
jgi:hypothetical protein